MCFTSSSSSSSSPRRPHSSEKFDSSTASSDSSDRRRRRRDDVDLDDLPRVSTRARPAPPQQRSRRSSHHGSAKGSRVSSAAGLQSVPPARPRHSRRGSTATSAKESSRGSLAAEERYLRPARAGGAGGSSAGSSEGSERGVGRKKKRSGGVETVIGLGITADETMERRESRKSSPDRCADAKRESPKKSARKSFVQAVNAPVSTMPVNVAAKARKTAGPTPVIKVMAPPPPRPPPMGAEEMPAEPPKPVEIPAPKPALPPPQRAPSIRAPSAPQRAPSMRAPSIKAPVSRESVVGMDAALILSPTIPRDESLSRKSSISSIISATTISSVSDSSDESDAKPEQVPELSPRLPNSYAHVRPTKPKRPPAQIMPSPRIPEFVPAPTPVKAPAPKLEPPRRKNSSRQRPTVRTDLPPPAPAPFVPPSPAERRPPPRSRKSSSNSRTRPPPPPQAESIPTTPLRMPTGPPRRRNSVSRTDTYPAADTVDYGAFVAESQKKKQQAGSNPDTVDYAAFVAESEKKKRHPRPTPINTDRNAKIQPAKRSARRNSTRTEERPTEQLLLLTPNPIQRDEENQTRERKLAVATVQTAADEALSHISEYPSSLSVNSSIAPEASQGPRRRRAEQDPYTAPPTEPKYRAAPPAAPVPPPRAPSPPPPKGHYDRQPEHHPPHGAAQTWYEEVTSGPREVEQDWNHAGEVWEQGVNNHAPDGVLPEAPSPPPGSDRGFTPGPQYTYGRMY